jgi:translation initiation factor IF-3
MAVKQKRINAQIRETQVAVINETGESLGILPIDEALAKAEQYEMDLVEI